MQMWADYVQGRWGAPALGQGQAGWRKGLLLNSRLLLTPTGKWNGFLRMSLLNDTQPKSVGINRFTLINDFFYGFLNKAVEPRAPSYDHGIV